MNEDDIRDSPVGWVADHIRQYVESDGKRGHHRSGTDTLLLTVRGRKTGLRRRTALIYGQSEENFIVVASNYGKDVHPNWYKNLCADPEVEVQVGAEHFAATARTADESERPALWDLMTSVFPEYERLAARTRRRIPVVVLEPHAD